MKIKQTLLSILVLFVGFSVAVLYVNNPEEAIKVPRVENRGILVETKKIEVGDYRLVIEAMGQIVPAKQIELKPQISGEIVDAESEFLPGGFFEIGEPIFYIDDEDYKIAEKKQRAILKQKYADLKLEMGRQEIAKSELQMLSKNSGYKVKNTDLALRQPQLIKAKSELDKAKSDVDMALLNLSRTVVNAPFDAMVVERNATIGDKVNTQTSVAKLVSTDEYWVKLSVPLKDMRWLNIPDPNDDSKVTLARIVMDGGRGWRNGRLLKVVGTLDNKSRLADMIVTIPDPLLLARDEDTDELPVILGDYVKVKMGGKTIQNVIRLPIKFLRDGNVVWAVKDGKLAFKKVKLIHEDRRYVYIRNGLEDVSEIITSDVPVAVDGMKIRVGDENKDKS